MYCVDEGVNSGYEAPQLLKFTIIDLLLPKKVQYAKEEQVAVTKLGFC